VTLRLLFSLFTITLLSGCLKDDPLLRIGTNVWPGYELFYLAREHGMLPEDQVRLVELSSSADVMEAMMVGRLEGAAVTMDEAIRLRTRGLPVTVILVCDVSDGADAIVVRPPADSLSDLKGMKVGVPFDSVGLLMLDAGLTEAGLTLEDIELIDIPPTQHLASYNRKAADALVSFEPFVSHLLDSGAVPVFDSSAIRGRIVDVLVVNNDAIERFEDQIHTLTQAFFAGRQRMLKHRTESLLSMNRRMRLPPEDLELVFSKLHIPGPEENIRLLNSGNGRLIRTAEALTTLMRVNGMIRHQPDLSSFISEAFIPEH